MHANNLHYLVRSQQKRACRWEALEEGVLIYLYFVNWQTYLACLLITRPRELTDKFRNTVTQRWAVSPVYSPKVKSSESNEN